MNAIRFMRVYKIAKSLLAARLTLQPIATDNTRIDRATSARCPSRAPRTISCHRAIFARTTLKVRRCMTSMVQRPLCLPDPNVAHEVFPVHADVSRLFRRGELAKLCKEALGEAAEGLDTRELAKDLIRATRCSARRLPTGSSKL